MEQARAAAGEKDVAVGAASVVQQCIRAGLLDEVIVSIVPVLLGGGVSLFGGLGEKVELEKVRVIETPDVTHITYRIRK